MKHPQNIDHKIWEAICQKCGQCCHQKIKTKHITITNPSDTCKYLKNNRCSIYETRLQTGNCLTIEKGLEIDYALPKSCPYTKYKAGYKGFEMPADTEEYETILFFYFMVEQEEERLGRDLSSEEIINLEITQERLDEANKCIIIKGTFLGKKTTFLDDIIKTE